MPTYQPTEDEIEIIRELDNFRNTITQWSRSSTGEDRQKYRSMINRRIDYIREIVILAGCWETLTISPPPAIGGYVMQDVDPFSAGLGSDQGNSLK